MMHPMALGELVCGMFSNRPDQTLRDLAGTCRARPCTIMMTSSTGSKPEHLMGRGIGFIDAHLLYSTLRRPGTRLWTHDKRLEGLARRFGVAHPRRD